MKTKSNLERVLEAGQFAVTGELGPPQSADSEIIRRTCNTEELECGSYIGTTS